MPHSPEARTGTAGRVGRRLLLLLALAACDDGGGGDKADNRPGAPGGPAKVAQDKGAGGGGPACEPSPAIDPALLNDTTPWKTFAHWMDSAGVVFDNTSPEDSTVARVALCPTCDSIQLRIVSEHTTNCDSVAHFEGTTRIAGVWVVEDGTVTPEGWGRTFTKDDSLFVFASAPHAATIVYPVEDRVHRAPPGAWAFTYCQDGHTPTGPQGEWRHATLSPGGGGADKGKGKGKGGGGGDPGPGTYGWMACASGCCQFYIPPGGGGGRGTFPPCPEGRP